MTQPPTSAVRTLPAKFRGFCWHCRTGYDAGEPISNPSGKTWVHEACVEPFLQARNGKPVLPPVSEEFKPIDLPSQGDQPVTPVPVNVVDAAKVREPVRSELEGATLEVDNDEVRGIVRDELGKAGVVRHEIVVKDPEGVVVAKVEGKPHRALPKALARARRPVLLVGPAGSGKTHLAEQVAKALGLPFAFIACSAGMSEGQLLGRLVPTGEAGKFEYLISEFVRCYENGGVFLFDEIDAADSNTLLVLNSALANGRMALPNRPEKPFADRHPDFVCFAAANTFGTGADRMYVGRNQLD